MLLYQLFLYILIAYIFIYLCFVKHWIVFLHYTMDFHYFGKNNAWRNANESSPYAVYAVRYSVFGVWCLVFSCHSLLPAERTLPFYFTAYGYNYGLINSYTVESRTFLMYSIIRTYKAADSFVTFEHLSEQTHDRKEERLSVLWTYVQRGFGIQVWISFVAILIREMLQF